MTVKGGTSPACAACRYQRRRCTPECPLAPYFPASDQTMFLNAHKLFGVSNIMKIINKMNTQEQKDEAMKSIKFESNLREKFPVDGCVGYINLLQQQLVQYVQELHYVYARLAMCREESQDHLIDRRYSPSSELHLGMSPMNNTSPLSVLPNHPVGGMLMPFEGNHYAMNENKALYIECNGEPTKQLWAQDLNYNNNSNNNVVDHDQIAMQMQMDHSRAFQAQHEQTEVDYNDMQFDSMADDRQSYIESKEACDVSSCESPWKDAEENVSKNELKSAAACFSLTSVN